MSTSPSTHHKQGGWSSILLLTFVVAVVLVVLAHSMRVTANRGWVTAMHQNSIQALALADSALEIGAAELSEAIYRDELTWASSCAALPDALASDLGGGQLQIIATTSSSSAPTDVLTPTESTTQGNCPIRTLGVYGEAQRTLEYDIDYNLWTGVTGLAGAVDMRLHNPYDAPATSIFNVAWLNGPTGSACATCTELWNLPSGKKTTAINSMGASITTVSQQTLTVSHALSAAQDFAQTGITLGGLSAAPTVVGTFAEDKYTASDKGFTAGVATGETTSGEGAGWCVGADALVWSVSGRSDGTLNAGFDAVTFNTGSNTYDQPVSLTRMAHYPYTDGSSANATGQLFSESWVITNPYAFMTAVSSSGNTITVDDTTGLSAGTIIQVYSGVTPGPPAGGGGGGGGRGGGGGGASPPVQSGELQPYTTVVNVLSPTQFTVTPAPTTDFVGSETLCGGICALFNEPSNTVTSLTTTDFTLQASSAAITEWSGGFTCLSGVASSRIRSVAVPQITPSQWHEVLSGE